MHFLKLVSLSLSLCTVFNKKGLYLSRSSATFTSRTATRQPASHSREHLHFIQLLLLPSPQTSQTLCSHLSYPTSFLPPSPLTFPSPPLPPPPPPMLPAHFLLLAQRFTPFMTQSFSCFWTARVRPTQKLTNQSASSPPSSTARSSCTVNEDSWRHSLWSTVVYLSVETRPFRSPSPSQSQQLQ